MQTEYLTPQEFSRLLKVDISTVRYWMKNKTIPYLRINRTVRIRQDALEKLQVSPPAAA